MYYKKIYIFLLLLLTSCATSDTFQNNINLNKKNFVNRGFAIVFTEDLFDQNKVSKRMDNREMVVFQRNLKKGTIVRIKNILNGKTVIAKVGRRSDYPLFNNAVISERISNEIDLDIGEPYVEIYQVIQNSTFIAKKAKTYDKEKEVANKAPVDSVNINDLNSINKKQSKAVVREFSYIIKIADFYFRETAQSMANKILKESNVKNVKIQNLSDTKYRVFLGPYSDIKALQKGFNGINILNFENIEIITND
tara:strand:- start:440 stop:1192 length:753 start_codon:yes stop_codon:yes gene_type:complete